MVADPFDNRLGAAVADAEPFGGPAAEKGPAAGRPVEDDVADEDVLGRVEAALSGRIDDDLAAR